MQKNESSIFKNTYYMHQGRPRSRTTEICKLLTAIAIILSREVMQVA